MFDLPTLLTRLETQRAALAATERAIKIAEREYWGARGYTAIPRRERLLDALREDAARPTPLEAYIEGMVK